MHPRHHLPISGAAAAAAGIFSSPARRVAPAARRRPESTFSTAPQREALLTLSEAILPETDAPGAVEAPGSRTPSR